MGKSAPARTRTHGGSHARCFEDGILMRYCTGSSCRLQKEGSHSRLTKTTQVQGVSNLPRAQILPGHCAVPPSVAPCRLPSTGHTQEAENSAQSQLIHRSILGEWNKVRKKTGFFLPLKSLGKHWNQDEEWRGRLLCTTRETGKSDPVCLQ